MSEDGTMRIVLERAGCLPHDKRQLPEYTHKKKFATDCFLGVGGVIFPSAS